jgi:hypothetical protein
MRGRKVEPEPEPVDPTGFLIDNGLAEIILVQTHFIRYMVMLGYTFMHGALIELC